VTPALYGAFLAYQRLRPGWAPSMRAAADVVLRRGPRCPHVFAFGGLDELVPEVNVRAFAARMSELAEVREHCFDDAGHVLLFPSDPKRYTRILEETARRAGADA
jgi:pimeloyl-ACP methyl ester carboxylesterase